MMYTNKFVFISSAFFVHALRILVHALPLSTNWWILVSGSKFAVFFKIHCYKKSINTYYQPTYQHSTWNVFFQSRSQAMYRYRSDIYWIPAILFALENLYIDVQKQWRDIPDFNKWSTCL